MEKSTKRNLFLTVVIILVLGIIAATVYVTMKGPATPDNAGMTVIDKQGEDGKIVVKDLNDGDMSIPKFNYPVNAYDINLFTENEGIIKYSDNSAIGINVTSQNGEIDWAQVKASGIDFAMIRVGYRGRNKGDRVEDEYFEQNIKGAIEAGLDVGAYFFSQAISEQEAEQEAAFLIEKIQPYQLKYPISFNWEFVGADQNGKEPRTKDCTPTEVTSFAKAFCNKIKKTGRDAMFYIDKTMGYEYFNLDELTQYQIWYAEYQAKPAFYYDFKIWQYSELGTVPGIEGSVKMSLAMKSYSKK